MVRSTVLALSALLVGSGVSDAQFQRSSGEPGSWISVGVGAFSANDVSDGKSHTTWDFTNATSPQYRGSLEKAISNGGGYGLAATYVRAPIRYTSFAASPGAPVGQCPAACDAEVDVYSLGLTFHAAGVEGFHQVYGGTAGMTRYANFKRSSDGVALEPTSAVTEISAVFNYGFGYGLSRRTQIYAVQDYGFVFHSRDGLTGDQRNTLTVRTFRIGLRQGFGTRSPGRRR